MIKIFIDGKEGTTGLRIYERLEKRRDIELLLLSDEDRKNPILRKKMINSSDLTFLCLPDNAARESVSFVENDKVKIIDASTAHRTEAGWAYGMPELSSLHRKDISDGNRIAVPGCHASGFTALVYPLVKSGILPADYPLSCFSVTGYSGGGNKMISQYENENDKQLQSPRQYGLNQNHKHLREMKAISGLSHFPIFIPVVSDYYSGMQVSIPIYPELLSKKMGKTNITEIYKQHYNGSRLINVKIFEDENVFLSSDEFSGKDSMEISVHGSDERLVLIARFDNLGKGASGAAVQCMNLTLGFDETESLNY